MLKPYLREVSRGRRRARDLTYEEAVRAMDALIRGEYTDAQAGAFLVAERMKTESADEIRGFVDALRAASRIEPVGGGLHCAGPFDGRVRSFVATFPAAFVLSASGVPVTLPSCFRLPPKQGITLLDLEREARGRARTANPKVPPLPPSAARVRIVDAEEWCPPLARFRPIREELGMRTLFNTVEKLLRFTDASYLAVGIYHGTVFGTLAEALKGMGLERALIVQGIEGSEDLPVDKRARCLLVTAETVEELLVDPAGYGLSAEMPETEWTAERQGETAERALAGGAEAPWQNMTLLNSGVRLWLAGKAESIAAGIETARETIRDGRAWAAYAAWRSAV